MDMAVPWLAGLVMVAGAWRQFRHKRPIFVGWCLVGMFTLAASAFQLYPFRQRMILFLVPLGVLILVEGLLWLRLPWRWGAIAARTALAAVLLVPSAVQSLGRVVSPRRVEELRPVM